MLLQRERKDGVPVWRWTVGYALVVAACAGSDEPPVVVGTAGVT